MYWNLFCFFVLSLDILDVSFQLASYTYLYPKLQSHIGMKIFKESFLISDIVIDMDRLK